MESLDGFNVKPTLGLGYSRVTERKTLILLRIYYGVFFRNNIYDTAISFSKLLNIEYEIILSQVMKTKSLFLTKNYFIIILLMTAT